MVVFNKQQKGEQAEQQAHDFLQSKGFSLLQKNYRCYFGEIDLIMQDQEDIVFVEVRSRYRMDFGNATDSIDKNKQRKIIKTATHFLQLKGWLYKVNSRFDVIAIHSAASKMQLEWYKNAFWP